MINKRDFLRLIGDANFKELFVTELGWNRFRAQAQLPSIIIDEQHYDITAIAERNGFQILTCQVDELPSNSACRKIDTKLRRQANDYICIFTERGSTHHLWVVPVKNNEKRDLTFVEYATTDQADLLYSKVEGFSFELGEETNIVDLRAKVHKAFIVNSEKITKDFYSGFRKEHKAFTNFITGINDDIPANNNREKQWYTSVMLNRLMFCYFIQKKGFLNGDFDYLRHKLEWVKREQGENHFFHSFYKGFLINLFHDGLNAPRHTLEWERTYGRIPYLNGGMFDVHELEQDYADIDIADEAFERLFAFFDSWRWHLDTRITASGKDINPDVLGYIFEQYINDRAAMGAYYTKEDITEYIGRNCIIPFLMDKVANTDKDAFMPNGEVWTRLKQSGDIYIYDAVKKGHTNEWKAAIPSNIAVGIDTSTPNLLERRQDWNLPTPEPWALPNEIWRETIERLQRCDRILAKIKNGEITAINDFITYNLDIRSFIYDLLHNTNNHLLIKHFYKALQNVTILDPTCGSGAFLFAAMNILEPLYEVCIERMQEFNETNKLLFKEELAEITNKYRSNIQYFIFKSIILRNLYGVDIMVEATEIAKLRLFLKMVAVVEVDRYADNMGLDPLPDIDFNIRCGNSLVGYACEEQLNRDLTFAGDILQVMANQEFKKQIDEEMAHVATTYDIFKELQLIQDSDLVAFKKAKADLRERLTKLNVLLNKRLFSATHNDNRQDFDEGDIFATAHYCDWLSSHQPFHWLAEFYQIMHDNGGFDVIIGNPPYVEISKNPINYTLKGYSFNYKDLYAFIMERMESISNGFNNIGFIIPISFNSTPGFNAIFNLYSKNSSLYISSYADSAKMFIVTKRLSIILRLKGEESLYVTKYIRNNNTMAVRLAEASYEQVLPGLFFDSVMPPKISNNLESLLIRKILDNKKKVIQYVDNHEGKLLYFTRSIRNFRPFFDFPIWHEDEFGNLKKPSERKDFSVNTKICSQMNAFLNSNLVFFLLNCYTDLRNVNIGFIYLLPLNDCLLEDKMLIDINSQLMSDFQSNRIIRFNKTNGCNETYYFPVKSKSIIDEIDKELAKHFGFTEEELDFIINYDIKYRMGDDLNND